MHGYVDANGVHTFYEVAGDGGDPVLFLHGGLVSGDEYAPQRHALSQRRTVILPDRRGHGRTPEVDAPFGYQTMADDTIAFMDAIGLQRAHVVGHSDGGILALLLAVQWPDRVASIVPISANTRADAVEPQMRSWLESASVEEFQAAARQFAPERPDWPQPSRAFFVRMREMILTEPSITPDDLARITARALIVGADRDFVTLEDLATQFRSIPNAQLAIVPGTGHELTSSHPDIVNAIIERFLDDVSAGPARPDPPR
jgi:pimeloyl-ACP methyl ester carboxylesterase